MAALFLLSCLLCIARVHAHSHGVVCTLQTDGSVACDAPSRRAGAALAAVRAASTGDVDSFACLRWQADAPPFPEEAAYVSEYRAHVSADDLAALDAIAAVARADSDVFLRLNAFHALHAAFSDVVLFSAACLPFVTYADGRELPLGVFAALTHNDVIDLQAARTLALKVAPARVVLAGGAVGNDTSRCNATAELVECERLEGSVTLGVTRRSFLWQVPVGTAPAGGWPAVIHYHGSFGSPHVFSWRAGINYPFGLYWQGLTVKQLLDTGYAVITPESHLAGFLFWDTNLPIFRSNWEIEPDHQFVLWLLDEIANANGTFGALDTSRLYATGLSSGAYMTSRMAVNYNGRFRALAIHSGSYATCAGPICDVPALPADHPPTLFVHGEQDAIVGIRTMELYADQMQAQGLEHSIVTDPTAGHEWIEQAVQAIPAWFDSH